MVKRQYDEVDVGLQGLMSQKHGTEKELQDLHVTIGFSFNMLKSIQTDYEMVRRERNDLAIQKLRLLRFVSEFNYRDP
jgi:hypothetical protein